MRSISNECIHEIEIKNSRFITIISYIQTANEVSSIIDNIKKLYPKATHYCYGYICSDGVKSSDDGEPGGTAGAPILNVLEKENLFNVLVVVVRYFGGIKLGAGGLVRAYTKAVTETLKNSSFVFLIKGYKVKITFPYSAEKQVKYLLGDYPILDSLYGEDICYIVLVDEDLLNKLYSYSVEIIEELYFKKASF